MACLDEKDEEMVLLLFAFVFNLRIYNAFNIQVIGYSLYFYFTG